MLDSLSPEYLHTWFCVGVISWLETEFLDSEFGEELVQDSDEVTQREAAVRDHPLDLMELS